MPGFGGLTSYFAGVRLSVTGMRATLLLCLLGTAVAVPQLSCPAGKFQNGSACANCPIGRYKLSQTVHGCAKCAPGNFAWRVGSRACVECAAGQYQPAWGSSACISCAKGRASASTQQSYATTCTICAAGRFASAGASTCTACPKGKWTPDEEQAVCKQCEAGKFGRLSGQPVSTCQDCPYGQFQHETGQGSCKKCSTGRAGKSCVQCKAGTYSADGGAKECTKCPAGQYGSELGASSVRTCRTCAAGRFAPPGAQTCHKCDAGSFGPKAGMASCTACPAGQYATVLGAKTSAVCRTCSKGRFSAKAGSASCTRCPAGTYEPLDGQAFCSVCAAGKFGARTGESSESACVDCEAGQIQPSPGQTSCSKCPVGRAGSGTACFDCEAGKYANEAGMDECSTCKHLEVNNQHCRKCPKGQYQLHDMSTQCAPCPALTWSMEGSLKCRACKPGTWTKGDAGWHKPCVPKPTSCVPGSWGSWSACSKKCSPVYAPGVMHRTRLVIRNASGGGKACAETDIHHTSPTESTIFDEHAQQWTQTKQCPSVAVCDEDCQVSPWGNWDMCTASCGGGTTIRRRKVLQLPSAGGKRCPALEEKRNCNTASCWDSMAVCHRLHNSCGVSELGVHVKATSGVNARGHQVGGRFMCKRVDGSCQCRCTHHKGCCSRQGFVLRNTPLVGNVYPGVKSHAACCNLCSSQPQCESWQWGTDGVCKLMRGLPKYLGKSAQHALGIFNKNVRYFSGPNARLGETCDVAGMSTNVAGYLL